MSRRAATMLLLMLASSISLRAENQWTRMSFICGRLFRETADKKLKPLKGVLMTLQQVQDRNTKCCEGLLSVKSKKTNWRGSVDFPGLKSGYYWLLPEGQDQGSVFGIEIGKYGEDQCDTKFVLDEKGHPSVHVTITVD